MVDLGGGPNHTRLGFHYWRVPGAFASYPLPGNIGKFTGEWPKKFSRSFPANTTLRQVGTSSNLGKGGEKGDSEAFKTDSTDLTLSSFLQGGSPPFFRLLVSCWCLDFCCREGREAATRLDRLALN